MKKVNLIRQIIKIGSITIGILAVGILLMIWLSPYGRKSGKEGRMIKTSVVIDAPVEDVFSYLGNSDNARKWSVFVHHISTVNSEEVADGMEGSIRRCFVNEDELGKRWDEELLEVKENERRRISCYDYRGFPLTAGILHTEQLYSETEAGCCLLTFTLFFPKAKMNLIKELKMYFAAYRVAPIFEKNLNNIKMLNEASIERD